MSDTHPYVIQQGDYLAKLAFKMGFNADEVWNHSSNQPLRDLRPSPDVLLPGDILQVPAPSAKPPSVESGTSNDYAAVIPTVHVILQLKDPDGAIIADEPCEISGLDASSGAEPPTSSDGEGKLSFEVPVTVREIEVHLPQRNVTLQVRVGDMDPDVDRSGIQKRLQNLGYGYFYPDEDPDELLAAAVRAFQVAMGLEPTGAVDDATRKAILDGYGL